MTKDEALKLALEGLEHAGYLTEPEGEHGCTCLICQATIAVKEALAQPEPWEKFCDSNCVWTDHHPDCKLAQPEQEPVAWWNKTKDTASTDPVHRNNADCQPLYTTPPQRKPLTDEEIANTLTGYRLSDAIDITRAIEAAHGIKGEV